MNLPKLTSTERLLLWSLKRKLNYFAKHKKLAIDGSFYCDDERFIEDFGRCQGTIKNAKRGLMKKGFIKFDSGKYTGRATKYWMIDMQEGIKNEPSILIQEDTKNIPSKNKEGIKITKEGIVSTPRGYKNYTPSNNIAKEKANTAGSALDYQGQSSPASSMLSAYIGKTIDLNELHFLLDSKYRDEVIVLIRSNKINLPDGVNLEDQIANTHKGHPT